MKSVASKTIQLGRREDSIRCSPWDTLMGFLAVPVIFVYRETLDDTALLRTLVATLRTYPEYSGSLRKTEDALYIDCDDRGIRASTVGRSETLDEVMAGIFKDEPERLVDMLSTRDAARGRGPVFTVRFSQLRGGGTVIGLCWHHIIGDMSTFVHMMLNWSRAATGAALDEPIRPQDRHAYATDAFQRHQSCEAQLRYLGLTDLARLARYVASRKEMVTYCLSNAEVSRIRATMQEEAGRPLSTNDAVCAHMTSLIVRLDPKQRERTLAILLNWRPRLGLPGSLTGNFASFLNLRCGVEPKAVQLATSMRDAVDTCVDRHFDYFSNAQRYYELGGLSQSWRMVPTGLDPVRGAIAISNFSRYGVYDVEFEGQRPVYFLPTGRVPVPFLFGMYDGPMGDGFLFSAVLPSSMASALRSDRMQAQVHRYRPRDDNRSDAVRRVPGFL